uniref:Protein Mpv17 n=1 Tax=Rhizophora mucronata TaxID=61149 RepID=A0A2P2J427_RHIMU
MVPISRLLFATANSEKSCAKGFIEPNSAWSICNCSCLCMEQFMAREAFSASWEVQKRCSSSTALWIQVLDPCQCLEFLGGPSSGTCSLHVPGLHILEFLLIVNNEQVDLSRPSNSSKCYSTLDFKYEVSLSGSY